MIHFGRKCGHWLVKTASIPINKMLNLSKSFVSKAQSQAYRDHLDMSKIIKGDSDIFTKYKADKIYSSISLSVDPNYRGCSIGRRLIEAR